MNLDIYNHAMKLLAEKKEEFEAETELVNDEMTTLKCTFVRENAKYIKYEVVRDIPGNKYYNILSISVNEQGEIIYDIGEIYATAPDKVHIIDVNENNLAKVTGKRR